MDITDHTDDESEDVEPQERPRQLPPDLPTSLDDRRQNVYRPDVEIYDDWSGQISCPSLRLKSAEV